MIIVEDKIKAIVELVPVIQVNATYSSKPKFHWGDRHELIKYLKIKKDNAYPLVWLMLGEDEHFDNGLLCTRDCVFVIATRETNKDLLYDDRFLKSYQTVLNPVLKNLVDALKNSSTTRLVDGSYRVERKPDYTESYYKNDNDNYTVDLWDAIRLSISVEFNSNCLNPIKWLN